MTLELRCPDHPTYRAIRKPRVECEDCQALYEYVNFWREEVKEALDGS